MNCERALFLSLSSWQLVSITKPTEVWLLHQAVCAFAAPDATPLTLDFAGMAAIIALRANSTLELDNLIMRGFASRHLTDTAGLLAYTVPALGPWPSIVAEPGAAVRRIMTAIAAQSDCYMPFQQ